ncbi:MAG: PorV/PorQ family protein [Elusimicrobia bacterium]|nr:PorV/PorQ family protein [Elusimicrobiota bacterium]
MRTFLFLLAAGFALNPVQARAGAGLTGAPILTRPVGARSSGMGRAFTAVSGGAESVMYNPAGLGFASRNEICLAYMNGFGGGGYGLAAVPLKLGTFVLTPAFLYYNSGEINLNLSDGTQGAVTAELDKVIMVSGAYLPGPRLALGGTIKFTSINLAETASASARHFDFGALYRVTDRLTFGAASLNNGGAIKFEQQGSPAPATLRAGAAYKFKLDPPNLLDRSADVTYSDILLTADWSRTAKEQSYYQAGFEMNMEISRMVILRLRAGYLFDRPEENMTFGLGIKKGQWDFAFGYEAAKNLDSRYPVSLSREF